ncbi:hypothetical protein EYS14_03340 [Alteromonadaceae bacterium M269]|nr:hypothetical protein EYS14_03340 [Alteromonadaceae bacterium M269]
MTSVVQELEQIKVASQEQTAASHVLAQEVAGKMAQIDSKVNEATDDLDEFRANVKNVIPMNHNLFSNSLMRSVEPEGHPTGFASVGCSIEAVHPYTRGFEGIYRDLPPGNAAPSPELATETNPYWYGRFNKGARIRRGGLAGGWGGISDGHILKITSTPANAAKLFRLPSTSFGVFRIIGLRFWIKIVSGSLAIGNDAGLHIRNGSNALPNLITKELTGTGQDGWYLYDGTISVSEVTTITDNVLNFGLPHDVPCEIYIGTPYMYAPLSEKAMLVAAGETGGTPVFTPGEVDENP